MRVRDCIVDINPCIPRKWKSYSFHARSGDILFEVIVVKDKLSVVNHSEKALKMKIYGKEYEIEASGKLQLNMN
jgi:maltose phosphorylase